jgi:ribulose-phosphate 3-epimerase
MIVIMTVNPGFPAQSFIKSMVPKIKQLCELLDENGLKIELEVDGGINADTAPLAVGAGANILVAGNASFHGPAATLQDNINLLRSG